MGNPMMLGSSMTLGIVSNPHRVFTRATADDIRNLDLEDGERTGLLTRWIQHDALILPGNSGGPLVDMKGEVVGINELGGGGVGFAIPANVAAAVLAAARATGEGGAARRPASRGEPRLEGERGSHGPIPGQGGGALRARRHGSADHHGHGSLPALPRRRRSVDH